MEFILKLIFYFVLITIVRFVVGKVFGQSKEKKIGKKGEQYIDKAIYAKIYFGVAVIFTILLIIVGSFPSNVTGTTKVVLAMMAIGVNVILYVVSLMYYLWYIRLEEDKIICRSMTGRVREISCTEITYGKINQYGGLELYHDNKLLINIPDIVNHPFIMNFLSKNKVQMKTKTPDKEFVMEATGFYKGLSLVCVILFVAFTVLCIYTVTIVGILFFGIMFVGSLISCMKKMKEKIIVFENRIIIKRFLKKTREIPFSRISYITRKVKDNAEIIYLYSEDGLEFKVSKLYKNADMFEMVIQRQHWKCK